MQKPQKSGCTLGQKMVWNSVVYHSTRNRSCQQEAHGLPLFSCTHKSDQLRVLVFLEIMRFHTRLVVIHNILASVDLHLVLSGTGAWFTWDMHTPATAGHLTKTRHTGMKQACHNLPHVEYIQQL